MFQVQPAILLAVEPFVLDRPAITPSLLGAAGRPIEVELSAAAELEPVQGAPPPGQEAALVGKAVLVARIGQAVEPGVQLREEVVDGLHQSLTQVHGRPAFNFRSRARARSRATDS